MNTQLIPVFAGELSGVTAQLVDARLLHQFLESATRFNDWIKRRIEDYEFIEHQDYYLKLSNRSGGTSGKPRTDYHLSIDMAKELGMIERTPKGRQIRQYFIELERSALESKNHQVNRSPELIIWDMKIKRDGQGRYCLNDLHRASGGGNMKRPTFWIAANLIDMSDYNRIVSKNKLGTYATKELATSYAKWISGEFYSALLAAFNSPSSVAVNIKPAMPDLTICGVTIRQDNDGRYSLRDLYEASGSAQRHKPEFWLGGNYRTQEFISELNINDSCAKPLVKYEETGTYICKELMFHYAMWIGPRFLTALIDAQTTTNREAKPVQNGLVRICGDDLVVNKNVFIEQLRRDYVVIKKDDVINKLEA